MDPQAMPDSDTFKPNLCNFWLRIVAFIIDFIFLGIVGLVLGLFFGDHFASLGDYARIYGVLVCIAYLGVLNSRLGGGQTLAKRLLGLRVVDARGNSLSFGKSAVRTLVLILPQMLNGITVPASSFSVAYGVVLGSALFGVGFALVYLYIFNRNTRQSLHDLLVGSYVVDSREPMVPGELKPVFKLHYVMGAACPAVLLGLFTVLAYALADQFSYESMIETQASISELDFVYASGVMITNHYQMGKPEPITGIQLTAMVGKDCMDSEHAKIIASRAMEADPDILDLDYLRVGLVYGYSIGIWGFSRSSNYSFPPQRWLSE